MADVATYTYLDNWTDETLPCAPTLEGWGAWLSQPDPAWNRPEAAKDGAEFAATTLRVLVDLTVTRTVDGFQFDDPPAETTAVFLRHGGPDTGWDPDLSTYPGAASPADAPDLRVDIVDLLTGWMTEPGEQACLACCADGPTQRLRYSANPPSLTILGSIN